MKQLFPSPDLPGFPAVWSPCKKYRYALWRMWGDGGRFVQWCCLNPSTATEDVNDPSVSRMIGYSKRWGYDGLCVTNAYGFRATNPKDMLVEADPVGPDNDRWLQEIRKSAQLCICAWGENCQPKRMSEVMRLLSPLGESHCLTLTKAGKPGHPLYLRRDIDPVPLNAPSS